MSQDKVTESSTGSIKIVSDQVLRWDAGVRFQTSPSIAFKKLWDALFYLQKP